MSRGKLYFMVGAARSGKSTLANAWVNKEINIYNGYWSTNECGFQHLCTKPRVIVCADNIRLAMHGMRFAGKAEPMVHVIKNMMIEALLDRGHDVLVDGTHTTAGSIKELLKIDVEAEYCIVDTDITICQSRAIATDQKDLLPVIARMWVQLCEWKDHHVQFMNKLREEVGNAGTTKRIAD